ncbi:hypothetical protein [Georgenia thermotolerans]|uniref:hypothetical protein n=1 Tax=Georgenia thermotolerans TaxID=527326 RepID=UPI00186B092C|nr:hypothetical protein [Georgenia thermotolerans]
MKGEHRWDGDEWDAFSGWRKVYAYIQRPGVRKSIKRKSHKKDRRNWRRDPYYRTDDAA